MCNKQPHGPRILVHELTDTMMHGRSVLPVCLVVLLPLFLTGCFSLGVVEIGCAIVLFALNLVAIVDLIRLPHNSTTKAIWILIIMAFPILGLVLYYVIGRKVEH